VCTYVNLGREQIRGFLVLSREGVRMCAWVQGLRVWEFSFCDAILAS
jgi:hypothetical protein